MSLVSSEESETGGGWLREAIFALDRWLQHRAGVYEYSTDPHCLFRIQKDVAERTIRLSDGTLVERGAPILRLHIWNEQMPRIAADGPSLAWGRALDRAIDTSLESLTRYVARQPDLREVLAICADMRLRTDEDNERIMRLTAAYGFEPIPERAAPPTSRLREFGENILGLLLVVAANPAVARLAILRRSRIVSYLSRNGLERRYLNQGAPQACEAQTDASH